MKLTLTASIAATFLLAGCAGTPTSGERMAQASTARSIETTTAAPSGDKQRVRCINEKVTGSHLPVRTCRTIAEWDRLKEEGQRYGRDLQGAQIGPPEQQ